MKFGSLQYRQGGESVAAAVSVAIRPEFSAVKVLGRSQVRAGGCQRGRLPVREHGRSAPLWLTSLVTFLFSDKKVTLPPVNNGNLKTA